MNQKSPQDISLSDRFPQRFSFNEITSALNETNSTFHFKESASLMRFIFECEISDYENEVKLMRKFHGTDEFVYERPILIVPTSRTFEIEFHHGFPIRTCDRLYVVTNNLSVKNVLIEVCKWSIA